MKVRPQEEWGWKHWAWVAVAWLVFMIGSHKQTIHEWWDPESYYNKYISRVHASTAQLHRERQMTVRELAEFARSGERDLWELSRETIRDIDRDLVENRELLVLYQRMLTEALAER